MLSVFQRLTQSNLVPQRAARKELEQELSKGRAAEAELRRSYRILEERIALRAEELARANEELSREIGRCKDAEARIAAISESVPYGAWVYELDGRVRQISSLFLELIGKSKEEVQQSRWLDFIADEDQDRVEALWNSTTKEMRNWDCEFQVRSRDGEIRHVLSRGAPLPATDGNPQSYAGFQLDVTDRVKLREELVHMKCELERQVEIKTEELRKANRQLGLDLADRFRTEIALRDSETELRAMFENALDGMLLLDDERSILDANGSALELFDYSLAHIRTQRWDSMIPKERLVGLEERWKNFLQGGTKRGEVEIRRANGNTRLVAFSSRANIVPGRHLITLRDITDHREAEESLRLLSQRLMRLQDDERRRIARELHDSTGQSLAALRMHLDTVSASASGLSDKARKSLAEAEEICKSCTKDIRTISYLLHPPLLDEVGLVPALEWYVAGFSERSGVKVTTEIREPGSPFSRELNTALYRIIQEALANIHKHSGSKEATIRLDGEGKQVVLEISDRGNGIDRRRLENCRPGARGLGVGLTGMRERLRQLGGKLEIEAANPGTLIRATLMNDHILEAK